MNINSHVTPPNSVSSEAFIVVVAFAALSLGYHWFGDEGWVPVLDSANLALHEAGHPLIGMFSEGATVYGGTLFQIAFPVAAVWHFCRVDNVAGAAGAMVWLGENLFNIARYMADARTQDLPLVGNGEHDWTEIFSRWGVLHLDGHIAGLTRLVGVCLIVVALTGIYRRWRADVRARSA